MSRFLLAFNFEIRYNTLTVSESVGGSSESWPA